MPLGKEELLLEIYKDQILQGRHIETQRLEVTKFVLVAAAALLSVAGALKFSVYSLPLCAAIIYLGKFGKQVTQVYVERFDGHMRRARAVRVELDGLVASGAVKKIYDTNPVVKGGGRVREYWTRIHSALMAIGVVTLIWNLAAVVIRAFLGSGNFSHRLLSQFLIQ